MDIRLRRSTEEDYPLLKEWFEDEENNVFFTSEFRGIEEYKRIFYLVALKRKENRYYMVCLDDEPIGFIALINIDYLDKSAQVWYVLGKKDVGSRGVMTKALGELCALSKEEFHTLHTWVVEDNIGSIRVLEKNGFERIGVQRESYYYGGKFKSRVLFDRIL